MKLPHEPEICIIGAGFAGLCAGVKLKEALNLSRFTIFDSNEEVGGTWIMNKYSGCACDIPSLLYSFSFAPKADWSKHYSTQPEILEYLKDVARTYELYPHIRFQTRVEALRWDDQKCKWIAVVNDTRNSLRETLEYDLVINGTGMLRIPNFPEEFHSFKGTLIHSAEWDPEVDLEGKNVGLVGSGASAVQIVPAIADKVSNLTVFHRRPPYIMPKLQFDYPEFAKWTLANVPGVQWAARTAIFWCQEMLYLGFRHNTLGSKIGEKVCALYRRSQIMNDHVLRKAMTPNYEFGCKRILPSNDYYPALQKPNVQVNSHKIVQVADKCIYTDDGTRTNLDVLILATGYKPHEYFAPLTIIGKDDENILNTWKSIGPTTYLGTVSNSLPNYFTILGPNTALGHNSMVFMIECQVHWMLKVIKEFQKREAKFINVKKSAETEFMDLIDEGHSSTVWGNADCGSWYVNPKGKITTLWPSNVVSFWMMTNNLDTEIFEFR